MKYKRTNVLHITNGVRQDAQKRKLLHSHYNLLLTFSGGQDSVFCLLILSLLQNRTNLKWDFSTYSKADVRKNCPQNDWLEQYFYESACKTYNEQTWIQNKIYVYFLYSFLQKFCYAKLDYNRYTLLWCNHFWQQDSFFTMEHVSKLSFCFCCTNLFFIPIKKVFSERYARDWRHRVTQRSSDFVAQSDFSYKPGAFANGLEKMISCKSIGEQNPLSCSLLPFVTYRFWSFNQEQLCVQGHTKSDRAEAVLFNLIRGAGINGISTLRWKQIFFSFPYSNHKFYPIFLHFFKKTEMTYLSMHMQKLMMQEKGNRPQLVTQNKSLSTKSSYLAFVNKKEDFFVTTYKQHVTKKYFSSKKKCFSSKNMFKNIFYYQLKYKNK